ncbi:MAG: hypothetical protein QF615_04270 [Planctomycetota bacterium]|nr:hypothetical protein [Planctomycetota bacterium]
MTIAALALCLSSVAPSVPTDHGNVEWFSGTFEEAVAQAKANDQIIFLDFFTDW